MQNFEIRTQLRCAFCRRIVFMTGEKDYCRGCVVEHLLNDQQRQVFRIVRKHQPTTIAEVADEMRFASTSSAYHHLKTLRQHDLIDWKPNAERTIHETRW